MNLKDQSSLIRRQKVESRKILLPFFVLLFTALLSQGAALTRQGEDAVGRISVDELILLIAKKKPVSVIDVRNLDSYDSKIRGALQIPLDEVESNLKKIPRNAEVVTYCA
ncbi:MAG: rhodanese-like domain-containing protein [Blastocatellia bacterium]|nr:rhodanese-like domain-containing protein [Blastocatellia bacterium]